ncbi:hypothetical protein D1624_26790 [Klebsiella pneumoniae]|nr:hypothetical protein D1624_26790 [Klebsiella pneumoniae]
MFFCLVYIIFMSVIILSRQLTMVSAVVFGMCYVTRFKINAKRFFLMVGALLFVILFLVFLEITDKNFMVIMSLTMPILLVHQQPRQTTLAMRYSGYGYI